MYFVVEYQGKRQMVKARTTATITDICHIAFGFDKSGDDRCKDAQILLATTDKQGAMRLFYAEVA